MNIAREILEKHLNKDLDIKTYLKGSALTYEVVLDALDEAINYTHSCESDSELLHKLLQYLSDEDELIGNRTHQQIIDNFKKLV
jgi:hypothetical protein